MGPLLILSLLLLAGAGGGKIARLCRVPGITGNILAGVLIGFSLFKGLDAARALQPLSTFAMGLIAASMGSQLSYRRIHNALRRIVGIAVCETICTAVLVTLAVQLFHRDWATSVLLGVIAVATAPATTVALIREVRAKGSYVKTLLSVVALDSILCIVMFAFVHTIIADYYGGDSRLDIWRALFNTGVQLVGSLVIGLGLGRVIELLIGTPRFHSFSTTFVAILICTGLSSYLGFSAILTALFFGVYLGNRSPAAEDLLEELQPLEPMLYTCFFTLAGTGLHLDTLWDAGFVCVAYLVVRVAAKFVGCWLGGVLTRTSRRIWANVPLGLVPQAGVAIGLVVVLEGDSRIPAETTYLVDALVLAAVTINEMVGPFLTRTSLRRSREAGLDRPRLMEFLQEEFILVGLKAGDKWEALRKLTDFFVRTHNVPANRRQQLYDTVVEREKDLTTAIGRGAAIPHGRIDAGTRIGGVLGICREGVDFDAPDGQPVHLIMLIVTPKEHEKRHLEVMASLASMVSDDLVRERLTVAIDANDAWEVIEGEEARGYNYFLEEAGEEGNGNAG